MYKCKTEEYFGLRCLCHLHYGNSCHMATLDSKGPVGCALHSSSHRKRHVECFSHSYKYLTFGCFANL